MNKYKSISSKVKYFLDDKEAFVIENYNYSKPFSNFFPGIAGLWGIPMWVFYVNRGQCVTSFGIEAKDKAIMEFQPANKSYRLTSLQGFRTFVKLRKKSPSGTKCPDAIYWEPFQNYLLGTNFKKESKLSMTACDLTLEEVNFDLGLVAKINYFTLPDEPYSALIRRVTIKNIGNEEYEVELVDGLPMVVPFGLTDVLNKNISRTVEAWVKVCNLDKMAPYYRLNVEVSDKPEVTHIKEGNFFFSFNPGQKDSKLLRPIVEASCIFGHADDFVAPANFLGEDFQFPSIQKTSNRTPCALVYSRFDLKKNVEGKIISLFGYAYEEDQLNRIVSQVTAGDFIDRKADRNKEIIERIMSFTLTHSSSREFNFYSGHTFLDNVLRGGVPVSVKANNGNATVNVYNRKHGDLERDYNYFLVAPTFYSQGNGNYRDVNQNRRNDGWFNTDVKDSSLINFLNLIQADGYNPLIIKGTAFLVEDRDKMEGVLDSCLHDGSREKLREFLKESFLLGSLLNLVEQQEIKLKVGREEFLDKITGVCRTQELAAHGEGFWTDHWTYNLDLIESYISLYPENLRSLLFEKKVFSFYHNSRYVLPRDQRYIMTERGVRQYKSVEECPVDDKREKADRLKTKNGEGRVYFTDLTVKILCLIANKIASLDPSGIGVEMDADKPAWYDALNGLPGLLGSSISETFEVKRLSSFLLEAFKKLSLEEDFKIPVFEELSTFFTGLSHILSFETDPFSYWQKSNDIKEHYRQRVRSGIDGIEKEVTAQEIKNFLKRVIDKTEKAVELAKDENGFFSTYFYHEVTEYEELCKGREGVEHYVRSLKFKQHKLPLFLEGYVHALRAEQDKDEARRLYWNVRKSSLFDKKIKMYKVNVDLSGETEEIGRTRIFPPGWLENESIWLHMEYKFILELLRCELFEEFYENFKNVLIPFLNPEQYGRSIIENSSFIVSSAHEDKSLHGRGFVARLSGSTAEYLHIWLYMNVGKNPFSLDAEKKLVLTFSPVLEGWLFTKKKAVLKYINYDGNRVENEIPSNAYAFNFLGTTLVVYHNPSRGNTFGEEEDRVNIKKIHLVYPGKKRPIVIISQSIPPPYAEDIRGRKVERVDVYFE